MSLNSEITFQYLQNDWSICPVMREMGNKGHKTEHPSHPLQILAKGPHLKTCSGPAITLPSVVEYVRRWSVVSDSLKERLNVLSPRRAGPRNGAVEMVYRTGFTAAFSGRTNTATHANTFNKSQKENGGIL
jgi:hypothetical protein